MAVEGRLSADEPAALTLGDQVTIKSGVEFARRSHTTGAVARITGKQVVGNCSGYIEYHRLRDGTATVAPAEPNLSIASRARGTRRSGAPGASTSTAATGPALGQASNGCGASMRPPGRRSSCTLRAA